MGTEHKCEVCLGHFDGQPHIWYDPDTMALYICVCAECYRTLRG